MALANSDMYLRQRAIFDSSLSTTPIAVVGAGSLGSWVVLGLAKLGFSNITVYDDDKVELHNVPNQVFGVDDQDSYKVNALAMRVVNLTGVPITPIVHRFERQAVTPIMIVTPDNMATRLQVAKRVQDNTIVNAFIDGRMGGQDFRVYCIDPKDRLQYDKYIRSWYFDEAGSTEECTARGVGYNAVMCSMWIVNMVKSVVMGEPRPFEIIQNSKGYWNQVSW